MRNHTDLLVFLAKGLKARTYLEIGVNNKVHNFDLVPAKVKIGVDPNPAAKAEYVTTSDAFFRDWPRAGQFDLIFIDGLHHADQVQRDFEHALEVLSAGGIIVLHDTNPAKEEHTHVPRDRGGIWCGDVYRFASRLAQWPDLLHVTVDFDNGCTVVWRDPGRKAAALTPPPTWKQFDADRSGLNRMTPEGFLHAISAG